MSPEPIQIAWYRGYAQCEKRYKRWERNIETKFAEKIAENRTRMEKLEAILRLAIRARDVVFNDPGDACRWNELVSEMEEANAKP